MENIEKKMTILRKFQDAVLATLESEIEKSHLYMENGDEIIKQEEFQEYINNLARVRDKIQNDREITEADFKLLSLVMITASDKLSQLAKHYLELAETSQEIAKLFLAN